MPIIYILKNVIGTITNIIAGMRRIIGSFGKQNKDRLFCDPLLGFAHYHYHCADQPKMKQVGKAISSW